MKPVMLTCVIVVCISAMEIVALLQGVNGVLLSSVIGVVAGLGGYQAHKIKGTRG